MSIHQFATFLVNGNLCGTNILQIREVIKGPEYSPVPQAPDIVEGLMNLRGQIVTVINVAKSLGLRQHGSCETCIILKTDDELVKHFSEDALIEKTGSDVLGLLVDEMGEVVDIDDAIIDSSPANTPAADSEYIKGVVKLEDELMTILSLKRVLAI